MDYLTLTPFHMAMALKDRRKEMGLTQKETADRIGMLPKTVSALESHPERCTVESLFKLISALELEITLLPKHKEDISEEVW